MPVPNRAPRWWHPHHDLRTPAATRGARPAGTAAKRARRDRAAAQRRPGVSRRCDGTSASGSRRRRIAARSIVLQRRRASVDTERPCQSTNAGRGVMGEAKVGEEFITHEFDEAIAIQRHRRRREALSRHHPVATRSAPSRRRWPRTGSTSSSSRRWAGARRDGQGRGCRRRADRADEVDPGEGDDRGQRQRLLRGPRGAAEPQAQAEGLGRRDAGDRARPEGRPSSATPRRTSRRAQKESSTTLTEELAGYAVKIAGAVPEPVARDAPPLARLRPEHHAGGAVPRAWALQTWTGWVEFVRAVGAR